MIEMIEMQRAGQVARSLVGGLELLVSLLRAPQLSVLTAASVFTTLFIVST